MSRKLESLNTRLNEAEVKKEEIENKLQQLDVDIDEQKITKYNYTCQARSQKQNLKKTDDEVSRVSRMIEIEESKSGMNDAKTQNSDIDPLRLNERKSSLQQSVRSSRLISDSDMNQNVNEKIYSISRNETPKNKKVGLEIELAKAAMKHLQTPVDKVNKKSDRKIGMPPKGDFKNPDDDDTIQETDRDKIPDENEKICPSELLSEKSIRVVDNKIDTGFDLKQINSSRNFKSNRDIDRPALQSYRSISNVNRNEVNNNDFFKNVDIDALTKMFDELRTSLTKKVDQANINVKYLRGENKILSSKIEAFNPLTEKVEAQKAEIEKIKVENTKLNEEIIKLKEAPVQMIESPIKSEKIPTKTEKVSEKKDAIKNSLKEFMKKTDDEVKKNQQENRELYQKKANQLQEESDKVLRKLADINEKIKDSGEKVDNKIFETLQSDFEEFKDGTQSRFNELEKDKIKCLELELEKLSSKLSLSQSQLFSQSQLLNQSQVSKEPKSPLSKEQKSPAPKTPPSKSPPPKAEQTFEEFKESMKTKLTMLENIKIADVNKRVQELKSVNQNVNKKIKDLALETKRLKADNLDIIKSSKGLAEDYNKFKKTVEADLDTLGEKVQEASNNLVANTNVDALEIPEDKSEGINVEGLQSDIDQNTQGIEKIREEYEKFKNDTNSKVNEYNDLFGALKENQNNVSEDSKVVKDKLDKLNDSYQNDKTEKQDDNQNADLLENYEQFKQGTEKNLENLQTNVETINNQLESLNNNQNDKTEKQDDNQNADLLAKHEQFKQGTEKNLEDLQTNLETIKNQLESLTNNQTDKAEKQDDNQNADYEQFKQGTEKNLEDLQTNVETIKNQLESLNKNEIDKIKKQDDNQNADYEQFKQGTEKNLEDLQTNVETIKNQLESLTNNQTEKAEKQDDNQNADYEQFKQGTEKNLEDLQTNVETIKNQLESLTNNQTDKIEKQADNQYADLLEKYEQFKQGTEKNLEDLQTNVETIKNQLESLNNNQTNDEYKNFVTNTETTVDQLQKQYNDLVTTLETNQKKQSPEQPTEESQPKNNQTQPIDNTDQKFEKFKNDMENHIENVKESLQEGLAFNKADNDALYKDFENAKNLILSDIDKIKSQINDEIKFDLAVLKRYNIKDLHQEIKQDNELIIHTTDKISEDFGTYKQSTNQKLYEITKNVNETLQNQINGIIKDFGKSSEEVLGKPVETTTNEDAPQKEEKTSSNNDFTAFKKEIQNSISVIEKIVNTELLDNIKVINERVDKTEQDYDQVKNSYEKLYKNLLEKTDGLDTNIDGLDTNIDDLTKQRICQHETQSDSVKRLEAHINENKDNDEILKKDYNAFKQEIQQNLEDAQRDLAELQHSETQEIQKENDNVTSEVELLKGYIQKSISPDEFKQEARAGSQPTDEGLKTSINKCIDSQKVLEREVKILQQENSNFRKEFSENKENYEDLKSFVEECTDMQKDFEKELDENKSINENLQASVNECMDLQKAFEQNLESLKEQNLIHRKDLAENKLVNESLQTSIKQVTNSQRTSEQNLESLKDQNSTNRKELAENKLANENLKISFNYVKDNQITFEHKLESFKEQVSSYENEQDQNKSLNENLQTTINQSIESQKGFEGDLKSLKNQKEIEKFKELPDKSGNENYDSIINDFKAEYQTFRETILDSIDNIGTENKNNFTFLSESLENFKEKVSENKKTQDSMKDRLEHIENDCQENMEWFEDFKQDTQKNIQELRNSTTDLLAKIEALKNIQPNTDNESLVCKIQENVDYVQKQYNDLLESINRIKSNQEIDSKLQKDQNSLLEGLGTDYQELKDKMKRHVENSIIKSDSNANLELYDLLKSRIELLENDNKDNIDCLTKLKKNTQQSIQELKNLSTELSEKIESSKNTEPSNNISESLLNNIENLQKQYDGLLESVNDLKSKQESDNLQLDPSAFLDDLNNDFKKFKDKTNYRVDDLEKALMEGVDKVKIEDPTLKPDVDLIKDAIENIDKIQNMINNDVKEEFESIKKHLFDLNEQITQKEETIKELAQDNELIITTQDKITEDFNNLKQTMMQKFGGINKDNIVNVEEKIDSLEKEFATLRQNYGVVKKSEADSDFNLREIENLIKKEEFDAFKYDTQEWMNDIDKKQDEELVGNVKSLYDILHSLEHDFNNTKDEIQKLQENNDNHGAMNEGLSDKFKENIIEEYNYLELQFKKLQEKNHIDQESWNTKLKTIEKNQREKTLSEVQNIDNLNNKQKYIETENDLFNNKIKGQQENILITSKKSSLLKTPEKNTTEQNVTNFLTTEGPNYIEFQEKTNSELKRLKQDYITLDKKLKEIVPLQYQMINKNTELLEFNNAMSENLMKLKRVCREQFDNLNEAILPGIHDKIKRANTEISKNYDFLNTNFELIERVYKKMQTPISDANINLDIDRSPKSILKNDLKKNINTFDQRALVVDEARFPKIFRFVGDNYESDFIDQYKEFNLKINPFTIGYTLNDTYLFIANNDGELIQYSLKNGSLVKNYHQAHDNAICMMVATHNNYNNSESVGNDNYLMTADLSGNIIQWSMTLKKEVKFFDRIHDGEIDHMVVTQDNVSLFSSDKKGNLKQFCLQDFDLVKNYRKPFGLESGFTYMEASPNSKYLVISDGSRTRLSQILISKKIIEFDYYDSLKEIYTSSTQLNLDLYLDFFAMIGDGNNCHLITASITGFVTKISLSAKRILRYYANILEGGIYNLVGSNLTKDLFLSNDSGCIIQWSIDQEKTVKKYNNAHSCMIEFMEISTDKKHLITKDIDSCVKYWDIEAQQICKNIGYITEEPIVKFVSI